eukprot:COSAG06_NODE_43823_length_368_cov_1.379182_1_plen_57_part_01
MAEQDSLGAGGAEGERTGLGSKATGRAAGRQAVYQNQTIHVGGLGSKEDNERLEERL